MGKVTLYFRDGSRKAHKCRSSARAIELMQKNPNCNDYFYSDQGDSAPRPIKRRVAQQHEFNQQELEQMLGFNR